MIYDDLERICNQYVPDASRHPNSWDLASWWPAHEIGHLLVARPEEIGQPFFGIGESGTTRAQMRYARCVECAAMSVSQKLLKVCGEGDLADLEIQDTDHHTIGWWYSHKHTVKALCKRRGVARIPRTTAGLEAFVQRKLATRR